VGDPYYPGLGNGGYDVLHYDLSLDITPPAQFDAVATITAVAAAPLGAFNLDLAGLVVDRVEVNG
ncbi:MAG: M1 family metallopeptidase, partial [Actinobacteria bacterium]|nr:M1 family metallopeptidase [Actinomycetota bacterium]NIS32625.1 M1 family metallopeptidase [Actinomycetota bacterium]NIT96374.1 M1 family metallopeptidase [Actinomycetota bacterium]NIU20079.1 M1 family metallopeptidase [Actinomycetota bacterium]NIU67631.1 M1 family metallopeptidase [Actinomycetota bacterium]